MFYYFQNFACCFVFFICVHHWIGAQHAFDICTSFIGKPICNSNVGLGNANTSDDRGKISILLSSPLGGGGDYDNNNNITGTPPNGLVKANYTLIFNEDFNNLATTPADLGSAGGKTHSISPFGYGKQVPWDLTGNQIITYPRWATINTTLSSLDVNSSGSSCFQGNPITSLNFVETSLNSPKATNGSLKLQTDKDFVAPTGATNFHSGMLTTNYGFRYGYFEARIKVPKGKGLWPSFWLFGTNSHLFNPTNTYEEIDIMETYQHGAIDSDILTTPYGSPGHNGNLGSTWRYACGRLKGMNNSTNLALTGYEVFPFATGATPCLNNWPSDLQSLDISKDFFIYAVDWRPDSIVYFLNNRRIFALANDMTDRIHTIILANGVIRRCQATNLNHPENLPNNNTPMPNQMEVDYVRVWKRNIDFNRLLDAFPSSVCRNASGNIPIIQEKVTDMNPEASYTFQITNMSNTVLSGGQGGWWDSDWGRYVVYKFPQNTAGGNYKLRMGLTFPGQSIIWVKKTITVVTSTPTVPTASNLQTYNHTYDGCFLKVQPLIAGATNYLWKVNGVITTENEYNISWGEGPEAINISAASSNICGNSAWSGTVTRSCGLFCSNCAIRQQNDSKSKSNELIGNVQEENKSIKLYPTIITGFEKDFHIHVQENMIFTIYDINGVKVFGTDIMESISNVPIPVLSKGLYRYTLIGKNHSFTGKITVIK